MDKAINNRQIVCRTCLKINMNLFNIYEPNNEKVISEKLMECTTIKVNKDDGLPMNICADCLEKLNVAYDFRKMAVEMDKILYNLCINESERKLELSEISNEDSLIKEEDSLMDIGETNIVSEETSFLENNTNINNPSDINATLIANANKQNEQIDIMVGERSYSNNNGHINREGFSDNPLQSCISNIKANASKRDQEMLYVKNVSRKKNDTNTLYVESQLPNFPILSESLKENNGFTGQKDVLVPLSMAESKQVKEDDEDINLDFPLEGFDTSEYEHLKTTLSRKEKITTKVLCKVCNRSFAFNYYYKMHLPQHIGKLPYKCNLCDKAFAFAYILRKHRVQHSGDRPFKCKICEKAFKYQPHLYTHMKLHTENIQYKCPVCDKVFTQNLRLKMHLRRHNSEKEFTCEICGKSFVNQSDLYGHTQFHNTEKKFVCSKCGKAFKTSVSLRRHGKTHAEVKIHKCNDCDKSFQTTFLLAQHIYTHTGERPYPCKFCDKTFRQRSALYNHIRVHTGECPYSCKLCPEKFKYSHHLASHVKVHHK